MPKRVYLIRHGETEGTVAGRLLGSTDLPLTAKGMSQVRRVAELLPSRVMAQGTGTWCVASPLLRAQQTAEAIAGHFGLPVSTDPDLREMDFGAWEGLTAAEVEERFPGEQAQWASPTDESAFPGGERLREFDQRIARVLGRILGHEAEVVLVFAHGGAIRALACGLLGLGRDRFWLFDVRPASVMRIDLFDRAAMLSELWSVSDREAD
jgi:broad specificity phosphatase PhoE